MKVERNISIFTGEASRSRRSEEMMKQQEQQKKRKNVFAGGLSGIQDDILLKKQEAQKKAMKVVSDAWEADSAIDDDIRSRQDRIKALEDEIAVARKELRDLDEQKEALKETYGIGAEGLAEEDIELLEKHSKMPAQLTEEEKQRYQELEEQGIAEYYGRCQDIDKGGSLYRQTIRENEKAMREEIAVIKGIRQERLKHHPMADASKEADAIREAAGKEIIGMLADEAKNHVDEEQTEREEQAQEAKEKKEEEEELLAKRREEKEEAQQRAEELADSMPVQELLQLDSIRTEVQKEVQDIVDKMKLVAEDIKGAVVNESV